MAGFATAQPLQIVGDEALQKLLAVAAIDTHDAAVGQSRDVCALHGLGLDCKRGKSYVCGVLAEGKSKERREEWPKHSMS
jgi:hypothetical protein